MYRNISFVLLLSFAIWNVEGFLFKRSVKEEATDKAIEEGCKCFNRIGGGIFRHYFKDSDQAEEIGEMAEDAMTECLRSNPENVGKELDCLDKKHDEFKERFGEVPAYYAKLITEGLLWVGESIYKDCEGQEEAELKQCAGDVLESLSKEDYCDADCGEFLNLFGQLGALCGEEQVKAEEKDKKSLNIKRVFQNLHSLRSLKTRYFIRK